MLTYVSARLNRVCVCVCVLGYSGVPGIAWYAPLLEPLFFSLLLWRKGGERERKEECSACVCDARLCLRTPKPCVCVCVLGYSGVVCTSFRASSFLSSFMEEGGGEREERGVQCVCV